MMGVPTFYTRLLSRPDFTRELVAHMRLFVSGSAPLSAETHKEFQARTGHAILERYGMTETNMNTSNPYDGERIPGSVGLPLPGVEIRVTDPETGARAAAGRDRHDRGPRPQRVQGLLAHAREDQGRVPRGRLLHLGRPRLRRPARLRLHLRPRQGPDHLGRLQRLPGRGRGRDRGAARRGRVRRDRRAARRLRRGRGRGRHRPSRAPRSTSGR